MFSITHGTRGRLARMAAALALSLPALAASAAEPPLTLERAWQFAEQASPALKAAQANLAVA